MLNEFEPLTSTEPTRRLKVDLLDSANWVLDTGTQAAHRASNPNKTRTHHRLFQRRLNPNTETQAEFRRTQHYVHLVANVCIDRWGNRHFRGISSEGTERIRMVRTIPSDLISQNQVVSGCF